MDKSRLYTATGDEPTIDGYGIMETWGMAWPRIIAKVWYYESLPEGDPEKTDLKPWYDLLVSGNPEKVKIALISEGFLINAFERSDVHNRSLENHWFWKNTHIVVEKANSTVGYRKSPEYIEAKANAPVIGDIALEEVNGWLGVDDIQTKIVLKLPQKPEKEALFGQAIADYQAAGKVYPFTCCCAC